MHIILNVNPDLVVTESEFLRYVVNHVCKRWSGVERVAINFHTPRTDKGWLEALIVVACDEHGHFVAGQSTTIGAIQRTVGGGMEFHS